MYYKIYLINSDFLDALPFLTQHINIIFSFLGSCQILPEYFVHGIFSPSYPLSLNFGQVSASVNKNIVNPRVFPSQNHIF